jgi:hypothetical protein
MNKIVSLFRKFSSYILFIFTLLSFIFTENEYILLGLVTIAFLAFFKINVLELFKKNRYLSKLELFFSILLFIKVFLLFDINIYYKVLTYVLGAFFLVVYFISFSNTQSFSTNILGVKKNQEEEDEFLDEEEGFLEEDNFPEEEDENPVLEEDSLASEEDDFPEEDENFPEEEDFLEEEEVIEKKPKKQRKSKK